MTDREKAIVMARTGICMLKGEKFNVFYQYLEELFGRPIYTHEIVILQSEIEKRSNADFIKICRDEQPERERGKGRWNAYYHGEENGKSIFSYSCNQCGYGAPYNFIGGVCEQKKWNFCPNCGADMRGTE